MLIQEATVQDPAPREHTAKMLLLLDQSHLSVASQKSSEENGSLKSKCDLDTQLQDTLASYAQEDVSVANA